MLRSAFNNDTINEYVTDKGISVQSCADEINPYGTYMDNPDHADYPDWVGCPLIVHRRCISPMYDISNAISYNGIMKQQTRNPKAEVEKTFINEKSMWIDVIGKEKGNKNHFVEAQAEKVCELLEIAFSKSEKPSLYIISPFTTVVRGVKKYITDYSKKNAKSSIIQSGKLDDWLSKSVGTVHTFQGKEASEVVFLLGCDKSDAAQGAIQWVNSNIVNVAATRAKFRLYVIGDKTAWSKNKYLRETNKLLEQSGVLAPF